MGQITPNKFSMCEASKSFNCDVGCKGASPLHQEFSYRKGVTEESFYKIDDLGGNGRK